MFSRFASLALVALAANSAVAQLMTINTPLNAVVCRPLQITWAGGEGPWWLSAHPEGQAAAVATVDYNGGEPIEASPFTWTVNQPVGTGLFLRLRDSTGINAESGAFTVLNGSDTSCIGEDVPPVTGGGSTNTTTPPTTGGTSGGTGAGADDDESTSSSKPASTASKSAAAAGNSTAAGAEEEDGAFSHVASLGAIVLSAAAAALLL